MTHINFLVTALLDGIWQGAFLAAAMLLLLKLFPRLNPTTRFSLLWVALIAVVVLPLLRLASVSLTPRARMESQAPTTASESATAAPTANRKPESVLISRRQAPRAHSILLLLLPPQAHQHPTQKRSRRSIRCKSRNRIRSVTMYRLLLWPRNSLCFRFAQEGLWPSLRSFGHCYLSCCWRG